MGKYNREKAVEYADRWWNEYNPEFQAFKVDCTNYVSQCLWAGGAPMTFSGRGDGWWYRKGNKKSVDLWSYSWSVSHSLRWFLHSSRKGLQAQEVSSPDQLMIGDIIIYDFDGDGQWQHTTIVTAQDHSGMPLVNAHTVDSKKRYWAYKDSPAWTPNIKYKFFHIADEF